MNKFLYGTLLIFICSVALADGATSKLPKGVVASVNGVNISQVLLESNVKLNIERNGQKDTPELRKIILDELVARELFIQEATKQGLDKTSQAKEQLELLKQNLLVDLLLNEHLSKFEIKEEELRAEYDRQASLIGDPNNAKEYQLRHIIVAKESEAKKVMSELKAHESFENVAKKYSTDLNRDRGGLVGWVLPSQLPPAIANIVINMSANSYTQMPIQTNLGWIIIKLEDTRPYKLPSYEESKNQLKMAMIQTKKNELLKKLKESAKIIQ